MRWEGTDFDPRGHAMGAFPISHPISDGCVPSGQHPVLSQMASAECNLIKSIPAALTEQGELLDLGRCHLEERYPRLLQRMPWGDTGVVLDVGLEMMIWAWWVSCKEQKVFGP